MHAAYSPFRAAESGVAIVRANGGAFSTIVDSRGRIVGERASGDGVLIADVTVGPRWTLDRRLGDGFLGVCGVLVVSGPIARRLLRGSAE